MQLSDRKRKVLASVVNSYIASGEPVSSKMLCGVFSGVSAATLRNEMAELAELGLLEQPHTSAGRIPSCRGYRFYVNHLIPRRTVSAKTQKFVRNELKKSLSSSETLLRKAPKILAKVTNFAAISIVLSPEEELISQIKLMAIGVRNGMVILVTSLGSVKNSIFKCDFVLNDVTVALFQKILEENFLKLAPAGITRKFIDNLKDSLGCVAEKFHEVLEAVYQATKEAKSLDLHLGGQENLLCLMQEKSYSALPVVALLAQKDTLGEIFAQPHKEGVRVVVGHENQHKALEQSSLIMSHYAVNGKGRGVLAVIGPTRMDYARMIGEIECVSGFLGNLLGEILGN